MGLGLIFCSVKGPKREISAHGLGPDIVFSERPKERAKPNIVFSERPKERAQKHNLSLKVIFPRMFTLGKLGNGWVGWVGWPLAEAIN